MNKHSVTRFFKSVRSTVSKHSPEIFMVIGIGGMVTTTILAVQATPKALKSIEAKKKEENVDELLPIEVVKETWKYYLPAAITGATSIACMIGSHSITARRSAALATAYKISETALTEYKDKVVETIGEKKEHAIQEKVDKAKVEKIVIENDNVIRTGKGNTLCLDGMTGRLFESDLEYIRKAENRLNKRLLHDVFGYVSLNDFYDELGLDRVDLGDMLGWNTEKLIDIRTTPHLTDKEKPCVIIGHNNPPTYEYDR